MSNKRMRQFPNSLSTTQFVKLYTLHLLSFGDRYGQSIIDQIEERLKGKWKPSPGMVYPLLRQLEKNGYVIGHWNSEDIRRIRMYRLTEDGYTHLKTIKRIYGENLQKSKDIIELAMKDIYR